MSEQKLENSFFFCRIDIWFTSIRHMGWTSAQVLRFMYQLWDLHSGSYIHISGHKPQWEEKTMKYKNNLFQILIIFYFIKKVRSIVIIQTYYITGVQVCMHVGMGRVWVEVSQLCHSKDAQFNIFVTIISRILSIGSSSTPHN